MGRWEKEFSKNLDRKGSDGYPKKKGRLKVKLLLMVPAVVIFYVLLTFFTAALHWNAFAAIAVSASVVLIPFAWIYISYLNNKL